MRKAFAAIILTAMTSACTSIDCPVQNTVYTVYKLYKADGVADTLADTLTIYTCRKNGSDSILLNRKTKATTLDLPISYQNPTDTLIFELRDTFNVLRRDTVWIDKTNQPHFESVDCNISYFHEIISVRWTNEAIDSIGINKKDVNYDASTEHFHIYFKARN